MNEQMANQALSQTPENSPQQPMQTPLRPVAKQSAGGWKVLSAISLVLLLVALGGGAWLYTQYDDVVKQKDELVGENGRLIDLAESMQVSDDIANGWLEYADSRFSTSEQTDYCVATLSYVGEAPSQEEQDEYTAAFNALFGDQAQNVADISEQLTSVSDYERTTTLCAVEDQLVMLTQDIRFDRQAYTVWSFDMDADPLLVTANPGYRFDSNTLPRFHISDGEFYMSYGLDSLDSLSETVVTSQFNADKSAEIVNWSVAEICHTGELFSGCLTTQR